MRNTHQRRPGEVNSNQSLSPRLGCAYFLGACTLWRCDGRSRSGRFALKENTLKILIGCCGLVLLLSGHVFAQGDPSGRGSVTGDPAASSANPNADGPRGRSPGNPSGSGTATSGGRDDNGDLGRDTMPETAKQPTPQAKQKGLPK
jgi:hypothetical protein